MSDGALLARLGVAHPIVQAPMASVATPALCAATCEAGALGGIAVGAGDAATAARTLAEVRARTARPFVVNVFTHAPPRRDAAREAAWLAALAPVFRLHGAEPPASLAEPYRPFDADDALLRILLDARPAIVSAHFGLPAPHRLAALRAAGIAVACTVTDVAEARAARAAGCDVLVAQGEEAGGHRGVFDPDAPDARLGTLALVRAVREAVPSPVIAAGGMMTGGDVAAALRAGAIAAQLGTAFVACPESAASAAHRAALLAGDGARTTMVRAISGRPARCLVNRFTALEATTLAGLRAPDYPVAYDAGKALHAAATAAGEAGYGAWWAGTGAPRARALPAGELVAVLARELAAARDA